MNRPLLELLDRLALRTKFEDLTTQDVALIAVVHAADAVVQAIQHAGFLGHLVPDLGEALSSYQRAVEEWRRMNAAREPRYEVERIRKAAKAPILAIGKRLDADAARITAELEKIEAPIDAQIKAEEREAKARRDAEAAEAAERLRLEREAQAREKARADEELRREREKIEAERAALERQKAEADKPPPTQSVAASRPSDAEIINAVAEHFGVAASVAAGWLCEIREAAWPRSW